MKEYKVWARTPGEDKFVKIEVRVGCYELQQMDMI